MRTPCLWRQLLIIAVIPVLFGCGNAEVIDTDSTNSTMGEVLDGPEHTAIDPSQADWQVILGSTELEFLNVMSLDSPDSVSDRHFQKIGDLRNLKTLVIGSHSVTDKTLDFVGNCPQLDAVVFYDCPITDKGLLKLKTVKKLATVGLANTDVTDTGFRDALSEMPCVHFELYDPQRYGRVFDESACLNSRFLDKHWLHIKSAQHRAVAEFGVHAESPSSLGWGSVHHLVD